MNNYGAELYFGDFVHALPMYKDPRGFALIGRNGVAIIQGAKEHHLELPEGSQAQLCLKSGIWSRKALSDQKYQVFYVNLKGGVFSEEFDATDISITPDPRNENAVIVAGVDTDRRMFLKRYVCDPGKAICQGEKIGLWKAEDLFTGEQIYLVVRIVCLGNRILTTAVTQDGFVVFISAVVENEDIIEVKREKSDRLTLETVLHPDAAVVLKTQEFFYLYTLHGVVRRFQNSNLHPLTPIGSSHDGRLLLLDTKDPYYLYLHNGSCEYPILRAPMPIGAWIAETGLSVIGRKTMNPKASDAGAFFLRLSMYF